MVKYILDSKYPFKNHIEFKEWTSAAYAWKPGIGPVEVKQTNKQTRNPARPLIIIKKRYTGDSS